jgi:F0F1-type ATP synthase membrane subunit b/b'
MDLILPNYSLFFIMACFGVTLWLVHRFLIEPVGGVLAERARRIDGAEKEWAAKNEEYLSATRRLEAEIDEAARKRGPDPRPDFRQDAQAARQAAPGRRPESQAEAS